MAGITRRDVAPTATRPPNVLFLWSDQLRPDTLGAYGNRQIETPHLDRLAATGALFEQAYCPQPVCSPTRASALTGLYPHSHGVRRCKLVLSPEVPTLAELLRGHGYAGGYVGKWHLGYELRPQRGFDDFWASTEDLYTHHHAGAEEGTSAYYRFLTERGYAPRDPGPLGFPVFNRETAARLPEAAGKPAFMAQECIRFLEAHRDRPFILSANFLEPHFPYFGPFDGMYDPAAIALPASWYGELEPTVPRHYQLLRREYATRNAYVTSQDEWGWQELTARYWGAVLPGGRVRRAHPAAPGRAGPGGAHHRGLHQRPRGHDGPAADGDQERAVRRGDPRAVPAARAGARAAPAGHAGEPARPDPHPARPGGGVVADLDERLRRWQRETAAPLALPDPR